MDRVPPNKPSTGPAPSKSLRNFNLSSALIGGMEPAPVERDPVWTRAKEELDEAVGSDDEYELLFGIDGGEETLASDTPSNTGTAPALEIKR